MHLTPYLTSALALFSYTNALSIPEEAKDLVIRNADTLSELAREFTPSLERSSLEKRKGGGGKGGGSTSSGGKSGGSSSSSSSGRTSSTSNVGGATRSGSGVKPAYGGGKYYAGGAATPYQSGGRSPSGLAPLALLPVAGLGFFAGYWAYGAYMYPYGHPYHFYNRTHTNETNPNGMNETLPVSCLCGQYEVCSCDDNPDQAFLDSIVGNGSTANIDPTVARVAVVNGTKTLYLNGTLANGTTASGGTDDAAGMLRAPYQAGMWALAGAVGYAIMML